MPLLEVIQTRQVSASVRLDEATATQVDQYATFIHASADDVVEHCVGTHETLRRVRVAAAPSPEKLACHGDAGVVDHDNVAPVCVESRCRDALTRPATSASHAKSQLECQTGSARGVSRRSQPIDLNHS